jgi:hypothetical protein
VSPSKKSEEGWGETRRWLLRAILALMLTVLALAPLAMGILDAAHDYGQREAGYECSHGECTTDEADARVAYFTWVLACVTGGLVIATIFLFAATFGLYRKTADTLSHAREDAVENRNLTRELFTTERRPWIQAPKPTINDTSDSRYDHFNATTGAIYLRFDLKNTGLSPAFDTFVYVRSPTIRYNEGDHKAFLSFMREMASVPIGENPVALFPQDSTPAHKTVPFNQPRRGADAQLLVLAGFVGYRFAPDGEFHFSPFLGAVKWRMDNNGWPRSPMVWTPLRSFRLSPT